MRWITEYLDWAAEAVAGSLRCLALQLHIWKWCSVPGCASGCCLGSYITCFRFAPFVYLTNKWRRVLYYCCAYRCYMLIISRFRWIINLFVCPLLISYAGETAALSLRQSASFSTLLSDPTLLWHSPSFALWNHWHTVFLLHHNLSKRR